MSINMTKHDQRTNSVTGKVWLDPLTQMFRAASNNFFFYLMGVRLVR